MTSKEAFIEMVEEMLDVVDITELKKDCDISIAIDFFEELKSNKEISANNKLTENGIKILKFMQENYQKYNNVFKAKDIGEGLFTSGRSVSGSMKKLVTEGFVEKIGSDPVTYAITNKGKQRDLN